MKNNQNIVISDTCINIIKQSIEVALIVIVLDAIMSDKKDVLEKIDKWLEVDRNEL